MQDQEFHLIDLKKLKFPTFEYQETEIFGVGKHRRPIINLDPYIDHSQDEELHIEVCMGMSKVDQYSLSMFWGALPPEERARFNYADSWSEMVRLLDQFDPTGVHRRCLEEIYDSSDSKELVLMRAYKYCYFAMGAVMPWFFQVYLKFNYFKDKTTNTGQWTRDAVHFPKVIKYMESLPFKVLGRALFFTTYPGTGVTIHRDSYISEHKDHNINLFFSPGWRPSFIWDARTKQKTYLEQGARSYFFNNRDYHGVDPENRFRYTLRIDGEFTEEFQEQMGLEDGYTWKWSYMNQ